MRKEEKIALLYNSLGQYRRSIDRKILRLRALRNALDNLVLLGHLMGADGEQRKQLFRMIDHLDVEGIKSWIKRLNGPSYSDLRAAARAMRIKNYSRMTKEQLQDAIKGG